MKTLNSLPIQYRNNKKCWGCFCTFLFSINYLLNYLVFNQNLTDSYRFGFLLSLDVTLSTLLWRKRLLNNLNVLVISISITFLSTLLISESTFFLFIYLVITNFVIKKCLRNIPSQIGSSFTLCELTIVVQACFTFVSQSFLCILTNLNPLGLLNEEVKACSSDEVKVLQILFFGLFVTIFLVFYFNKRKSNVVLNYLTLLTGLFLTYLLISIVIKKEAILWLINLISFSTQRVWLITLWCLLFAVTLFFCLIQLNCSKTVLRKFFHIMMIIVYTTGIQNDINLLYFVSACFLWILVIIEILRKIDQNYASKYIDMLMDKFRNENDKGWITLTHIYLLVGFSTPIWLSPTFEELPLNLTAGLITVGYGDTAGSIVGSFFGRNKWANSSRTFEGTFSAIFAQILGLILTCNYLNKEINLISFIISSTISSLIEAKTNQIDNLILPFYFNIIWLLYFYCLNHIF